ncbi:hypothetical protein DUI87_30832 [Hirundo rustica rustica]|uniref:Maestro/Maestro-like HEAT-repeats domain-containing protein n=1 Tax=Hirundo rustica rustica TaxID=333673 RepID=A0A3M0IWC1_HIRRU|nr:hypothetical protein DUI87_30832 [Hirundo rustica rustica]
MVRYIHQWLMANESAECKMDKTLLDLTDAQPDDVVMTLLRVAPSCDRAAMSMWMMIMSTPKTVEEVQQILLDVLGNWPEYSTCTSDGDKRGVFDLAVLECMDLSGCSDSIMNVLSRHLRSQRTETRRQVLRALLLLRDDPSLTQRMWTLTKSFVELLQESDSDVIRMTIFLLSYLFLDKDTPIPSPIALTLAEVLLPLFDNDDSQVQLLSMFVFRTLMSFVVEEGRKPLKRPVCQSLVPLFFHCQDENLLVAEASRTTLLRAAQFLKKRSRVFSLRFM